MLCSIFQYYVSCWFLKFSKHRNSVWSAHNLCADLNCHSLSVLYWIEILVFFILEIAVTMTMLLLRLVLCTLWTIWTHLQRSPCWSGSSGIRFVFTFSKSICIWCVHWLKMVCIIGLKLSPLWIWMVWERCFPFSSCFKFAIRKGLSRFIELSVFLHSFHSLLLVVLLHFGLGFAFFLVI